jgi:hypothetical protein
MFSYDAQNFTLNFLTSYFVAQPERANLAKFRVVVDQMVAPGDFIGIMEFNGGRRVWMIAPPGAAGRVAAVNGRIAYDRLTHPPVQFAVRLKSPT